MSDSCSANLRNYQIQLQQVEAALISDPDNNELNKLKTDLQEVIALTKQLMSNEGETQPDSSLGKKVEYNDIEVEHHFEPGDTCLAPWSEDGQFYEAKIEDVTSDGQCTVVFNNNRRKVSEVCLVSLLKPLGRKKVKLSSTTTGGSGGIESNKVKKQLMQEQKDQLKKKQQKKKERLKELEEEREKDKMKWQSFNNKAYQKHLKGASKKSIFASPESVTGRVGVGTCGVGGKPMTEFTQAEKWKRAAGASTSTAHSRYAHNYRYK